MSQIIYDANVSVASSYKNGMPGNLRVVQFDCGSAILEISSPGTVASTHTRASELREFAAKLIESADAFDAWVPVEVSA